MSAVLSATVMDEPQVDDFPPERATTADIRNALRLRFEPGAYALLWEVADRTGSMARRFADAVAFGLWPSHGHLVEGVEIKISRSDFLSEMKNPGKSQPVFQFCDRWWLACPKDMVKPDELPPTWGLLELTAGGALRARVKAPKLEPVAMGRSFLAALLRRHAGRDDDMYRRHQETETQRLETEIRARIAKQGIDRYSHEQRIANDAIAKVQEIKDATGIDFGHWNTGAAADWIAAIKFLTDHGYSNFTARRLGRLRAEIAQCLAAIDASGITSPEAVPRVEA